MKVLGCFFVSLLWVFLVICYLWWIRKGPVIPAHNTLQRQTEFRAEKTTRQQKTKVFIFIRWTQETRYILVKGFSSCGMGEDISGHCLSACHQHSPPFKNHPLLQAAWPHPILILGETHLFILSVVGTCSSGKWALFASISPVLSWFSHHHSFLCSYLKILFSMCHNSSFLDVHTHLSPGAPLGPWTPCLGEVLSTAGFPKVMVSCAEKQNSPTAPSRTLNEKQYRNWWGLKDGKKIKRGYLYQASNDSQEMGPALFFLPCWATEMEKSVNGHLRAWHRRGSYDLEMWRLHSKGQIE